MPWTWSKSDERMRGEGRDIITPLCPSLPSSSGCNPSPHHPSPPTFSRHPPPCFPRRYVRGLDDAAAKKELLRFKGVGPKTVACVLMFCLGRAEFPVDTHVWRITRDLGTSIHQAIHQSIHVCGLCAVARCVVNLVAPPVSRTMRLLHIVLIQATVWVVCVVYIIRHPPCFVCVDDCPRPTFHYTTCLLHSSPSLLFPFLLSLLLSLLLSQGGHRRTHRGNTRTTI